MKQIILFLTLSVIFITGNMAQTVDDFGRIALRSDVSSVAKLSDEAKSVLLTKLDQITTGNGIAATGVNPRFVITAKVDIVGKDIVPGPPQMFSQKLMITLFVGDAIEQKLFGHAEISVTGIGTSETKAYINAINKINSKNMNIKTMLEESKAKIVAWYTQSCATILNESKSLSAQNKYGQAIYNLSLVPDVCSECYQNSLNLQEEIYTKKIETEGLQVFQQAQALWAQSHERENAAKVMQLVLQINPNVSFIDKVQLFIKDVSATVEAQELREWEQKIKEWEQEVRKQEQEVKKYDDKIKLEQMRIQAYKEVAVEFAKNQPKEIYRTIIW
jgi:hypothetical protein